MAKRKVKVFNFSWDAGGYGNGVLLVAANTEKEAIECANSNSKHWTNCKEDTKLKYVGDYTQPIVILESIYQE